MKTILSSFFFLFFLSTALPVDVVEIPLPEHPRPDFMRSQWINLNGLWDFRFDLQNTGENDKWYIDHSSFKYKITVPFPWGSKLSGVSNEADIAWYSRKIEVPADWSGKQVFIIIGASDWKTKAWLDGQLLGEFQGGYTPFEFDITSNINPGTLEDATGNDLHHNFVCFVIDNEKESNPNPSQKNSKVRRVTFKPSLFTSAEWSLKQWNVDCALPGGLAIYGEKFGRYPFDPTLIFIMK